MIRRLGRAGRELVPIRRRDLWAYNVMLGVLGLQILIRVSHWIGAGL